jgi:hypothetical protein
MRHHISYDSIVEEAARDFINEQEEMLVEAVAEETDFDRIRDLDRAFNETVRDTAYSTADAAFIIRNSDNVETDRGLTEGQDHDEAQSTIAAFTFGNDVWEATKKMFEELTEAAEDAVSDVTIEDDKDIEIRNGIPVREILKRDDGALSILVAFDDVEEMNFEHVIVASQSTETVVTKENIDSLENISEATKSLIKVIFDEDGTPTYRDLEQALRAVVATAELKKLVTSEALPLIEPGSQEERTELLEWLRAGRKSERGGYPLGGAYIDARCGTMWGTPEHAYVVSDGELRKRLPHLSGKYKNEIKAYWDKTFGGPTPTNAEEMLLKVREMIRDGSDNFEFREIAGMIDAVLKESTPKI